MNFIEPKFAYTTTFLSLLSYCVLYRNRNAKNLILTVSLFFMIEYLKSDLRIPFSVQARAVRIRTAKIFIIFFLPFSEAFRTNQLFVYECSLVINEILTISIQSKSFEQPSQVKVSPVLLKLLLNYMHFHFQR